MTAQLPRDFGASHKGGMTPNPHPLALLELICSCLTCIRREMWGCCLEPECHARCLSQVSLPKGKGIALSILEERAAKMKKALNN